MSPTIDNEELAILLLESVIRIRTELNSFPTPIRLILKAKVVQFLFEDQHVGLGLVDPLADFIARYKE
jgi:hypothetical protein